MHENSSFEHLGISSPEEEEEEDEEDDEEDADDFDFD